MGLTKEYLKIAKVVDASWIDFEYYHGASGGLRVLLDVTVDGDICSPRRSFGYGLRGNPVDHSLCACYRIKVGTPRIHGENDNGPCTTLQTRVTGKRFKADYQHALENLEMPWERSAITAGSSFLLGGHGGRWKVTGVQKMGFDLKSPALSAAFVSQGEPTRRVKIEPLAINPSSEHGVVGRLMWNDAGSWKDVCYKGGLGKFSKKAAKVACMQLGFQRATLYNARLPAPCWLLGGCELGPNYPFVEFDCAGSETALQDCVLRSHRKRMCAHTGDIIIGCDDATVTGHTNVDSAALDSLAPSASSSSDENASVRPEAP